MKFLERVMLATKAFVRPQSIVWAPGIPQWSRWNFQAYVNEAYGGNPFAYRAIEMILTAAAGIPVKPFVGETELDEKHPIHQLLHHPSPVQSWPEFVKNVFGLRYVSGHSYVLSVGPDEEGRKPPMELYPQDPYHMTVKPSGSLGPPVGFYYRPKGQGFDYDFLPSDEKFGGRVWWWHTWNPLDPNDAQPPGMAAARAIDTSNAYLAYNKAIMDNGGVLGTVFTTDQLIPKPKKDEIKESFASAHGGPQGAGSFALVDGGLKPFKIGTTPQEMSWQKGMESCGSLIGLAFGVAPELLGVNAKTFNNYREARASLYIDTVLPVMDEFLGSFGQWLGKRFQIPELRIRPDLNNIEALSVVRQDALRASAQGYIARILTLNQALGAAGYPPEEGGDVRLSGPAALTMRQQAAEPAQDQTQLGTDNPQLDEPAGKPPKTGKARPYVVYPFAPDGQKKNCGDCSR